MSYSSYMSNTSYLSFLTRIREKKSEIKMENLDRQTERQTEQQSDKATERKEKDRTQDRNSERKTEKRQKHNYSKKSMKTIRDITGGGYKNFVFITPRD